MFKTLNSRPRLLWTLVILVFMVAGGVALVLLRGDGGSQRQAAPSADRMSAELIRAAERAGICSAANAVGVGLRGEYFTEASLHGEPALVRVDGVVDFDSSMAWPPGTAGKPVSVRWRGWVKPPLSGGYQFHADAPGMQVWVARHLVAGEGVAPGEKVDMAAGRFYPIEIVLDPVSDSKNRIRLEWTAPHGARYVLPKALLHLPTDTTSAPGN